MDLSVERFGGFAEDVKTPDDIREVLHKVCGGDSRCYEYLLASGKLPPEAEKIAKEELLKLKQ